MKVGTKSLLFGAHNIFIHPFLVFIAWWRLYGFPENYVLIGTQEEQKKFIGNAVEVNMARVLCEALVAKLYELNIVPQRFAA